MKKTSTQASNQQFHIYYAHVDSRDRDDYGEEADFKPKKGLSYQWDHTQDTYYSIVSDADVEKLTEQVEQGQPFDYIDLLHFTDEHEDFVRLALDSEELVLDDSCFEQTQIALTQLYAFENPVIGELMLKYMVECGYEEEEIRDAAELWDDGIYENTDFEEVLSRLLEESEDSGTTTYTPLATWEFEFMQELLANGCTMEQFLQTIHPMQIQQQVLIHYLMSVKGLSFQNIFTDKHRYSVAQDTADDGGLDSHTLDFAGLTWTIYFNTQQQ